MAAEKILVTDTLDSGFRVKYNNTVDSLINGNATIDTNGVIKFPKIDGSTWDLDIRSKFLTTNEVSALINPAIRQATEFDTGQVRKATIQEIVDGSNDFGYVSAAGLKYAFDNFSSFFDILNIGTNVFYENNVTDTDGVVRYGLGLDTWELMIEGSLEMAGKVSVGQGQILLSKEVLPNDTSYGVIGGTTYIDVTTPQFNVQNILGVKEIQSIDANPIQANGAWVFSQPLTIVSGTEPNQAITKQYFETTLAYIVAGGFKWFGSVPFASAQGQNITRSGNQLVDGSITVAGLKVLLIHQTDARENGLYVVQAGAWTRATDYNSEIEIFEKTISITNGATNTGSQFICRTPNIVIDVSELIYETFSKNYINPFAAHTNNTGIPQDFYGDNNFMHTLTVQEPILLNSPTTKLYVDTIKDAINNTITNLSNSLTSGYWQKIATNGLGTTTNSSINLYANNTKRAEFNVVGGLMGLSQIYVNAGAYSDPFASSGLGGYYGGIFKGNLHVGALSGLTKTLYSLDLVRANSTGKRSGIRFGNYGSDSGLNAFSRGIEWDGTNLKLGIYTNANMNSEATSNAPVLDATKIITFDSNGSIGVGNETPAEKIDLTGSLKYSETLKPLGVAPSASGMVLKSLITGSTVTNLWQNITIADIKQIGADHTFLKSNGSTLEWSLMTVGDIADIADNYMPLSGTNDFVKRISDEGERGFLMYGDVENTVKEGFVFTNPDTGILGIHAFRLNGLETEQYGFQLDKNGLPYWLFANGNRKRILTEEDSLTGGGGTNSWDGGLVTNDIHLKYNKKMTFGIVSNQITIGIIESVTNSTNNDSDFRIVANDKMTISAEGFGGVLDIKAGTIKMNGIQIDMSTFGVNKYLRATSSTKAEWVI